MGADAQPPPRELVVRPVPDAVAVEAVMRALEDEQLDDGLPHGLVSAWRSAGLDDAIDRAPGSGQALSPRSTRGATRA